MNVEKLQKVLKHMTEVPERCDMNTVILKGLAPNQKYSFHPEPAKDHIVPRCGTVGCIAGWTSELYGFDPEKDTPPGEWFVDKVRMKFAATVLELDERQASRLFTEPRFAEDGHHLDAWPLDLAREYEAATTIRGKVDVLRRRVELFIATNGEQ